MKEAASFHDLFLPGIPAEVVIRALGKAAGKELESGKFASPESSSALAVNAFGVFLERPGNLPPFPIRAQIDWPAKDVQVERQMRFPWKGGMHPWLDAAVETKACLIGIESKRFEPFRDKKSASLSEAYDRPVWGDRMRPFEAMRDALRANPQRFKHLDAAQLVKHAFGLVTEGRRCEKRPILLYLFAEPERRGTQVIAPEAHKLHRDEIAEFAEAASGAEVEFAACSYREWLATWDEEQKAHAQALLESFRP